jgi:hypothetical protein
MRDQVLADIADGLHDRRVRHGVHPEQEEHLVGARFLQARHVADAVIGSQIAILRDGAIADLLAA